MFNYFTNILSTIIAALIMYNSKEVLLLAVIEAEGIHITICHFCSLFDSGDICVCLTGHLAIDNILPKL